MWQPTPGTESFVRQTIEIHGYMMTQVALGMAQAWVADVVMVSMRFVGEFLLPTYSHCVDVSSVHCMESQTVGMRLPISMLFGVRRQVVLIRFLCRYTYILCFSLRNIFHHPRISPEPYG